MIITATIAEPRANSMKWLGAAGQIGPDLIRTAGRRQLRAAALRRILPPHRRSTVSVDVRTTTVEPTEAPPLRDGTPPRCASYPSADLQQGAATTAVAGGGSGQGNHGSASLC